jgi:hypothetical protein
MIDAGRGPIINIASLTAERCVNRYPLAAYNAAKAVITGQHLLVDGGRPIEPLSRVAKRTCERALDRGRRGARGRVIATPSAGASGAR